MPGNLQPLDEKFAIVGPDGRPTQYFIRWAQQRQIDITQAVSPAEALQIAQDFVATLTLQEGSGIALTPSGSLIDNPTITAQVQEILDQITDVHGSLLFRGASEWEHLAPGTAGQVLSTNGTAADPSWVTTGGGGGGSLVPPVATNFPTLINSPSVTDTGNGVIITGAVGDPIIRAILKSLPVGDFTVTIRVTGEWGIAFNRVGIVFRDTDNKFLTCGPLALSSSSQGIEISQWTNSFSFSSGVGFREIGASNVPEWIRCIFNSSTNDVTLRVSWDGIQYLEIGTSTFLGTVNAVGIGLGQFSTTRAPWASFIDYQET